MTYKTILNKGLSHLKGRDNPDRKNKIIDLIESGKGNIEACYQGLGEFHQSCSLLSYFVDENLEESIYHAGLAAKFKVMVIQKRSIDENDHYINSSYLHLYPLLSNNSELIEWSMQNVFSMYGQTKGVLDRNNTNKFEYHSFNTILALRGEWDLLAKRCEYIIQNPTKNKRLIRYQVDHEFYFFLAQGDIDSMQKCLDSIVSKRVRSKEFGFGLTENLISTYAVIFAKIAWLHGYKVEIKSPWVPSEWLPTVPLITNINSPYGFMNDFDIFTPYGGDFFDWSPAKERFNYRDITIDSMPQINNFK